MFSQIILIFAHPYKINAVSIQNSLSSPRNVFLTLQELLIIICLHLLVIFDYTYTSEIPLTNHDNSKITTPIIDLTFDIDIYSFHSVELITVKSLHSYILYST